MSADLADTLSALRDQVLDTDAAEGGEPPGAEVFDAIVRHLATAGETNLGLDETLSNSLARRLAWGDSEVQLLADVNAVCRRVVDVARHTMRSSADVADVTYATGDVGCAAARAIATAAVERAARERAAHLREELAQHRLRRAIERQQEELARLKAALGD